jgi:hypothetical protein
MKLAAGGSEWANVELDAGDRLFHAAAIARFLDGEHLAKGNWERVAPQVSDGSWRAFGLRSAGKALVWVVRPDGGKSGPAGAATLRIPVSGDGRYRVEMWDTRRGAIDKTIPAVAAGDVVTVECPGIANDLALKAVAEGRTSR